MQQHDSAKNDVIAAGARLRASSLSPGTTGNVSVRVSHEILMTATGSDLGALTADSFSVLGMDGEQLGGQKPTKEWPLHLALYEAPTVAAVVHTHQTFATALSCLQDLDDGRGMLALPVLTPYLAMRAEPVEVVDYVKPGSPALAALIRSRVTARPRVILLRNHGAVAAAASASEAVGLLIELEEFARIHFLTAGIPVRALSTDDLAELSRA